MDLKDIFGLEGKVALVTGSTKGIGRATAEVLAQAGAHVIISSRNPDDCVAVAAELQQSGLSAEAHACHIGTPDAIDATETYLRETHSGLDILVNNAVLSPLRTIEDTDLGLFRKAVEVDLQGYWFMSAAAARLMKPRGGGSIVNIASVAALHPDRGLALYSTLKTSLIGMSRAFALEYGGENIRVNTVMPGLIETRLAEKYDDATRARMFANMCLPRLGQPEEVGYSVLYLVSPAAGYVTGAGLVIDGGLSVGLT
ncbi:glucose 1-dehydrogenase [Sulfitobacter porphyrae]|uniref:Glucose 1-dehydrogenase n=1 Tax=Sulfitobacter porphyrae TaxID=1246864 RepID=A0ABW2B795_9RHOB|nr:short-chain dehydrogenase [Sulfitobacter porphyrae]